MNMDITRENPFQNDIIRQMQAHGWVLGTGKDYDRENALYTSDVLKYIKDTQVEEWKKFCQNYPIDSENQFIKHLVAQLKQANTGVTDKASRSYGTLGVLRHGFNVRNTGFSLCQFKPEHTLNPETLDRYKKNIFRLVPELVYSPYATKAEMELSGIKAKKWRIDLVLFINGLPVSTMELKSEFKQTVQDAIIQYKTTRLAKDPHTNKPEPLLSFKRGALVHFAVSQYEVYMATHLAGSDTFFLPFNKGTFEGGAGNDVPGDQSKYATNYLWNEVLVPENLLDIIGRFIHLNIEEKEDAAGNKYKKESLIFPRYHQWDVVRKLIQDAKDNGTGHKYLIQHSAGSGKSNSIAWTAHQLSSLYDKEGNKQFDSVIVITDRTILDAQLQDTIFQFEHADGVVGKINNKEGQGSKSEKLAASLEKSQPIIIVTIQTFPFVLSAIENSTVLKQRKYAVIADEAHSSQTGSTARQLKEVLMKDMVDDNVVLSSEDILDATIASRRKNPNVSYYAFTATPKPKTLELFGRLPNPLLPPSKDNLPEAFHVYSMRQAIEEGFILDVLKNYTNYKVVYKLTQKIAEKDYEVDSKQGKVKVNQWVRLHDHNISQKVKVIVEHYKKNIRGLLGGQAKAMVVTSSRKEAVRYKLAIDKYIAEKNYASIQAMVAFSGEVEFTDADPNSSDLIGEKFTEISMNPNLKGREMRKAFDSSDYQIMLVANKFQTGFDQPKLCAMYVDKKLGGVECVQTLSRLNRTYPGKAEAGTFVLDFFNEPNDIYEAFQPYYQTAELLDVSDQNQVFKLFNKLKTSGIFQWSEVEQLVDAFFSKNKSNAVLANICKPIVDRWNIKYKEAVKAYDKAKTMLELCKESGNAVLIGNAEKDLSTTEKAKDELIIFKKDLGTYTRFYEFMSQIVDYDNKDLEKLSLFARHLRHLLKENVSQTNFIDLTNIEMSHYRLSKLRQIDIELKENSTDHKLEPSGDAGTAKAKDKKEELLSNIIKRLNDVFITDKLTDADMINYANTIADKVAENEAVMTQIAHNNREQAMLGDFPVAIADAILSSHEAHQELMMQLLSDPIRKQIFDGLIYEMVATKKHPSIR